MQLTVIISFIVFTSIVATITYFKTKGEELGSSEGYFLGGRNLKAGVIAGSLLLTNLSAVQFVGMSAQAYSNNLCVIGWEVGSGIILVIVALVLLPRYLKQGITTIPQFVESRFDSQTRNIITLLFLVGYAINMLPVTLYSGSVAMSQIFNIEQMFNISYAQGIFIMVWLIGIIGSIYAVCGGLKAVAISDTINGVVLIIGGILVTGFALLTLGKGSAIEGVSVFLNSTPEKLNSVGSKTDILPFGTLFTGMIIANLFYWGTDQAIIQRGLGAKNLKEGQKGLMIAGFLKVLTPLIVIIPGVMAFQLFGPNVKDTESVYPMLVNAVLPKPLIGVFAAAMLGAILSTFNSVLNSASTLFAINIYKPKWGVNKSDADIVKVGRVFSITVALLSMIVAPMIMYAPKGLYDFFQSINLLYNIPVFLIVFMGYITKRVPPIAAKVGVAIYMVCYAICYFTVSVHYLYYSAAIFVICCIVMAIIGKLHPMEKEFVLENINVVKVEPWENRYKFGAFVIFAMISVYIALSPVGFVRQGGPDFMTLVYIAGTGLVCFLGAMIIDKKYNKKESSTSEDNKVVYE